MCRYRSARDAAAAAAVDDDDEMSSWVAALAERQRHTSSYDELDDSRDAKHRPRYSRQTQAAACLLHVQRKLNYAQYAHVLRSTYTTTNYYYPVIF